MQNHTSKLMSFLGQALGVPLGAIPLSHCRIIRPYLLEKQEISTAGTALMLAVPYVMTEDVSHPSRNLSLYAVPKDYHQYFDMLSEILLPRLKELYPNNRFALFADHSPIAEVEAAALCGLGMVGDHGLIITKDYGSFVFLAEIITDLTYAEITEQDVFQQPDSIPRCEGCGACRKACHGQCLPESRGTCLSAISQKKGILSDEDTALLRAQPLVWGCDTCQTVCPHNRRVIAEKRDTPIAYFRENRICYLDAEILAHMTEEEFRKRAYAWRGKTTIERNIRILSERRKA